MAKKLTEPRLEELNHKYEWSLTILNFMASQNPNRATTQMLIEVAYKTFDNQDLRGMRYIYSDINEMATMAFKQEELTEVNVLLKEKFGFDFGLINKKDIQKVKRIVKKGIIANADEYRFLLSRVDVIYDNKDYIDELNAINALLLTYTALETD